MKQKINRCVVALAMMCLFSSVFVWPQGGTGELTGLVTDPTGAVIVGATVDLVNANTGIARSTVTSTAGVYRFVALPIVGTYSLSVKQAGFKATQIDGIVISVGSTQTRDVRMEVGAPTETITVVGGAELVQTTESAVSTLIDSNIWQNMPLEVRSQNAFIELVAGAVPDNFAGNTRGAAVNGARGGSGNYLVEGVDNNEQGQGGRGQLGDDPGGASTSISPDAIAEYRVITNSFAAEYGKAGGFVTDTVLKSGTNQFHGSLFEYNRVQALAANNFFSNANDQEDSLVRNQFGGSIGGPIVKDKMFFFYSMEWHRMRETSPLYGVTTTQQFLDWVNAGNLQSWAESDPGGICMQYNGEPCPGAFSHSATLAPIFKKLANQGPFPLATTGFSNDGQGFWTYGLTYPVPVYGDVYLSNPFKLNEYRISGKFDYTMSSKDQLSFIYLLQKADSFYPYGGGWNDIGPSSVNDGQGQNIALSYNRSLSPTATNSFKISYLRHRSDFPQTEGYAGIPGILTAFDPMTVGFGMYPGLPQYFTDGQYQVQDHVSMIKGKHSFKAGVEYRRIRNASSFYNDVYGSYLPYGVEDLVTDLAFSDEVDLVLYGEPVYGSVYFAAASVNPSTGEAPDVYRGFRANEMAFYVQDDWRIHPRFTLNFGLRYEYFGPPHNFRPGIDSNFYWGTNVTPVVTTSTNPYFPKNNPFYAGVATGSFQVRDNEIWNKDNNNWAPRLGFAWDVLGNQKLVLRAGAGIMYDRIFNNVFENIRFNPPYFSDNQIGTYMNGNPAGALSTPGIYTVPFSSRAMFNDPKYAPKPNPRHMDQNLVSPYYEQLHLGLQWEFAKGYVFEPEYVATMGHRLIGYYDVNTFNGRVSGAGPSTRINTSIGADNYRNNNFGSNYHALQMTVRRNFADGLGFNVNYTWARALDYLSDLFNARGAQYYGPTDTMNIANDYGPADFHMKHRFVTTFSYELPVFRQNRFLGGWNINTIISLQSGVPFSPYNTSGDTNKDGRRYDRIAYIGTGSPMNSVLDDKSPADGYFNADLWEPYTCPAGVNGGLWCNPPTSRGSITGPGYRNVDFSIQKKFKITEDVRLSLMGNFFNFFNNTNFDLPSYNYASGSFGKSTEAFSPRITQLAFRIDF